MTTKIINAADSLELIVDAINHGDVVVLPTETVYGLAALAENETAVRQIFAIKNRPLDNPIIVHVCSVSQLDELAADVPGYAYDFAQTFWPGPLTLVVKSRVDWSWIQAGHDTIAVRMPEHAVMRAIIERTGPLAAPSANLSGKPSPTTAAHCLEDLDNKLELIVDGGPCDVGLESTVVDCTGEQPVILRPGGISREDIEAVPGISQVGMQRSARSPGNKYKHYSPRAHIELVEHFQSVEIGKERIMTIGTEHTNASISHVYHSTQELATNLYAWFREADREKIDRIYIQPVAEQGIGQAVMNRIKRAAETD